MEDELVRYGHAEVHPRPGGWWHKWKVIYFTPNNRSIHVTFHRTEAKAKAAAERHMKSAYTILERR
jgi:hypothetical protein